MSEEGKHVDIDGIDSVEDVLGTATLLVTVRKLGYGHGDADLVELGLEGLDLGGELGGREDTIEEGFGAELHDAGDEGGFVVGGKGGDEVVPAGFPLVVTVETEPDKSMDTETVVPSGIYDVVTG